MQLRQILKRLKKNKKGQDKIKEILLKYYKRLPDDDFWMIEYVYVEDLKMLNIMNKLAIEESTYYNHLKNALGKLEVLITYEDFMELFLMA